jgi:WLM domain
MNTNSGDPARSSETMDAAEAAKGSSPEDLPIDHSSVEDDEPQMAVPIHFHGKQFTVQAPADISIAQLSLSLAELLSVEPAKQKIMITPKPGIFKPPFPETPLSAVYTSKTKITLLGSTEKEISDLSASISKDRARSQNRLAAGKAAPKAAKNRDWKKIQEESTYTFQSIRPLPYLPNPERSQRFLERLANDAGIKAAMRAHKFSVGLLTEMNPAEHTTQESRTLGLNRNRGEVIELRLRTDRYDGYRDYKVIRKTLCHELAHNVFGEHDRNFWDLTGQIEKEVERGDWRHGGHKLSEDEFYNPRDDGYGDGEEHFDAGGWTGGEFVLGSGQRSSESQGLSRREILARAALGRAEKQQEAQKEISETQGGDKKVLDKP